MDELVSRRMSFESILGTSSSRTSPRDQSVLLALGFLYTSLSNLLRRPGLGNRKMSKCTSTDPEAYALSTVFRLRANKWAHVRASFESKGVSPDKCRAYGLEIGFGIF